MSDYGVTPVLPREIGVVPPKRNRLLAFEGSLYHGVMKEKVKNAFKTLMPRLTLLVNYWSDKSAGEDYTPLIATEQAAINTCKGLLQKKKKKKHKNDDSIKPYAVKKRELSSEREFFDDFIEWKEQELPKGILDELEEGTNININTNDNDKYDEKDVVLIHYDTKTEMFDVFDQSSKAYVRWMDWGINFDTDAGTDAEADTSQNDSGSIDSNSRSNPVSKPVLTQVNPYEIDVKALREWRASMPGGDPFLHKL